MGFTYAGRSSHAWRMTYSWVGWNASRLGQSDITQHQKDPRSLSFAISLVLGAFECGCSPISCVCKELADA